jgi:hypothetical protein
MSWSYLHAFWTTVVLNCVQPVNWQYCLPVQDWLFPAIGDYMRFKTEQPYASERKILQSLQQQEELKRIKQTLQSLEQPDGVDDRRAQP